MIKKTIGIVIFVAILLLPNISSANNIEESNPLPEAAIICITCHGANGIGLIDTYPNLRGQKYKYLVKQINDFKSGVRVDPLMSPMASLLLEKDIEAVVKYFSELK